MVLSFFFNVVFSVFLVLKKSATIVKHVTFKKEQKVAHDEKSKFFIFHTKIAYHTVKKHGGIFFLERFILIH